MRHPLKPGKQGFNVEVCTSKGATPVWEKVRPTGMKPYVWSKKECEYYIHCYKKPLTDSRDTFRIVKSDVPTGVTA